MEKLIKKLSGYAVIHDTTGKRITYTYNVYNQNGTIVKKSQKESFLILDSEIEKLANDLESKVEERMNLQE